ncbi:MAG: ferrous iron transport protein A [Butyricicoccaceae bacterium]
MSAIIAAPRCEPIEQSLSALPVGRSARILSVQVDEALRRRLLELGLIPGTRIQCLYRSFSGDPCAFLVRGTVLALRRCDSAHIRVQFEP